MRIFEVTDLGGQVREDLEKYIRCKYNGKYKENKDRLRVLCGKITAIKGNKVYCEELKYKVSSKKLLREVGIENSYYFLINKDNVIVSEQINHIFCPYCIERI